MSCRREAADAGLHYLDLRPRTEKELRDYLKRKEYDEKEIDDAIEYLKEYGYVDDRKYCMEYFRFAQKKGRSDYRIIRELEQKGVSPEISRAELELIRESSDFDGRDLILDDRTKALDVAMKMVRAEKDKERIRDPKFQARVARRLSGLGYDSSTVYHVLSKIKNEEFIDG